VVAIGLTSVEPRDYYAKKELAAQKSYLVKKHPEKSDAEIERIMKKSPFYGLNAKLLGLDKELH